MILCNYLTMLKKLSKMSKTSYFFSVASCWELAIKHQIGKLQLSQNITLFLKDQLLLYDIELIPIEFLHALNTMKLPLHHNDPFDRLIISQSQVENLPVITSDVKFKLYDVIVIW